MDFTTLMAFSIAVFFLAITPGPDIVYVAMRGLAQGKKAGLVAATGLITGVFFHMAIAVIGVSAVLAASPIAFAIVKYLGAFYIIYIGWNITKSGPLELHESAARYRLWQIYRQTVLMNILNPKVALFFLAFLPQFVNQQAGQVTYQLIILSLIFQAVSFAVMASIGLFSGMIADRVHHNPNLSVYINKFAGSLVMLLGMGIPLADLYHYLIRT